MGKKLTMTVLTVCASGAVLYLSPMYADKYTKNILAADIADNSAAIASPLVSESIDAYYISTANDDFDAAYQYWHENASLLQAIDTTPPSLLTRDISIMHGETVSLEDFIVSVTDSNEASVSFAEEPDLNYDGTQTIVIKAEDECGNITLAEASLTIEFDHEAPVISGVEEITITEGDSVSYKKGVTVTDNIDQDVKLSVNADCVDTDTPGEYEVIYSAVDSTGNEAKVTTTIYVLAKAVANPEPAVELTEEYIYSLADATLASILTDDMSLYDKASAIFWYCHAISFTNLADGNWIDAAYQGFVKRKGDCYVYAITAQVLLTRAGIPNFLIQRIESASSDHYWNVIDVGEGWHHFDSSWHTDGSITFYMTDAEAQEYSSTHRGDYYDYDKSLYAEIP